MNILGIVYNDESHDTSAALVCDGELVAAAEEERFTRRKHESSFPVCAIEYCLREAGISAREVDFVAVPDKPFRTGRDSYFAQLTWPQLASLENGAGWKTRFRHLALRAVVQTGIRLNRGMNETMTSGLSVFRSRFPGHPRFRYYDHHQAHAAAAFLTSGFDRAAVAPRIWST